MSSHKTKCNNYFEIKYMSGIFQLQLDVMFLGNPMKKNICIHSNLFPMKCFHIRRFLNLLFLMKDNNVPTERFLVIACGLWIIFWLYGKSVYMNFYGYFVPKFCRRGSISCISTVSFTFGCSMF